MAKCFTERKAQLSQAGFKVICKENRTELICMALALRKIEAPKLGNPDSLSQVPAPQKMIGTRQKSYDHRFDSQFNYLGFPIFPDSS